VAEKILILGGGQVAAHAASTIRKYDISSEVIVLSEESYLPYERPPLSKDFLLEKMNEEQCLFFNKDFYEKKNIQILNNEKIEVVDFINSKLHSKKNIFDFTKLLIATGNINKKLKIDNIDQNDIFYLRDFNESIKIKKKYNKSKNILIIGGGFIGLELTSSAIQLKKNVVVIEQGDQLMGRVVPKKIASIIQKKHEIKGVIFHLNTSVDYINKKNNAYEINLKNKKKFTVDMIIVGIGATPNTKIFENTDLKIDNGIITNEYCQTSIPNIYAAGDVSNFFHPLYKTNIRLESWKHAQNHGINAGKNIVNKRTIYEDIPWMWSDQYDLNLQLTGMCSNFDTSAKRGLDEDEGIVYFFIKNRKIIGACGVGVKGKIGKDVRIAGKLAEKKIIVNKEILSNSLKKLNKLY